MSRKHYQAIANDLVKWAQPNMTGVSYRELVRQISLTMSEDNARHSAPKFYEACGVEYNV